MADLSSHWTLQPGLDFLNHGSFGACPRPVLEAQNEWRARMEAQPVEFLARKLEGHLDDARAALAQFIGAEADDVAFVPNATTGVNTVIRALQFSPGDEVLTTSHAYNACVNAMRLLEPRGVRVATVPVPWPIERPEQITEAVLGAATPRTKLVLIDHITSPTGLIFPVAQIVARLAERGIDTLVDGAHAPGQVLLDLRAIGAAYYTGNCHKWLCTPKGSAFLHVRRDRQALLRPLSISHGANSPRIDRSRFRLEFDWAGTDDPSPFLCIPPALAFLQQWPDWRERNHALAVAGRQILLDALGTPAPAPESMLGSLAAVPLRDVPVQFPRGGVFWHPLQRKLLEQHRIEVPVMIFPAPPQTLVRISAQLYNSLPQYQRLAAALKNQGHLSD